MSINKGIKVSTQIIGLFLCMLLIPTVFATGNVGNDVLIGNLTNDNTTIGNETVNSVIPSYYSTYLSAGANTQFTVTFTNQGNKTLNLIPKVVATPNSINNIDESWITISPTNATVAPGATQKFEIIENVPIDTESGYYQGILAFTDNLVPSSTNYADATQLDTSVQAQPKIELQTSYISDNIEAGKDYTYQVKIKNVAKKDITIDPKLTSYNYGYAQAFSDDAIQVCAPKTIKVGEVTNVTIIVRVPENATGSYNGNINMNVNGNENDGSSPQIGLGFSVSQQPTVPYVKIFDTSTDSPITIEVSYQDYSDTGLRISPKNEKPAVELGLIRNSSPVNMTLVKSVESGSPSFGSSYPIWAIENGNFYQDYSTSHVETYKVSGAIGNWKLTILPKHLANFGYSITIGDNNLTK
jgi:hypothetical protein